MTHYLEYSAKIVSSDNSDMSEPDYVRNYSIDPQAYVSLVNRRLTVDTSDDVELFMPFWRTAVGTGVPKNLLVAFKNLDATQTVDIYIRTKRSALTFAGPSPDSFTLADGTNQKTLTHDGTGSFVTTYGAKAGMYLEIYGSAANDAKTYLITTAADDVLTIAGSTWTSAGAGLTGTLCFVTQVLITLRPYEFCLLPTNLSSESWGTIQSRSGTPDVEYCVFQQITGG